MFRRFADALSRTAALAAGAVVAALAAVRSAFASSTGSSLPPEYSEVLRLAQEKVQAATQPGALGNGLPIISDAGASAMLPWLGIVAAAAAMAAGVCAAWLSMPRTKKESSRCSPVLAALLRRRSKIVFSSFFLFWRRLHQQIVNGRQEAINLMSVHMAWLASQEAKGCRMTIRIGDRIRCKDGTEGKVVDIHKYGKEHHIVIKTDAGEERELNLSDYCKGWIDLFP